jgi:hypothetical protein
MQHPWERKRERESESDKGKQREHASDEHVQSPETRELKPSFFLKKKNICYVVLHAAFLERKIRRERKLASEKVRARKESRESMKAMSMCTSPVSVVKAFLPVSHDACISHRLSQAHVSERERERERERKHV